MLAYTPLQCIPLHATDAGQRVNNRMSLRIRSLSQCAVQALHVDLEDKDWLLDPEAGPAVPLLERATLGAIGVMQSHTQVLQSWLHDAPAPELNLPQQRSRRRVEGRRWTPILGKRRAADASSAEPLLLILEDDVDIGDSSKFAHVMRRLLAALNFEAVDAVNLLSPNLQVCQNRGPTRPVRNAHASGFDLFRPWFATSRTHGVLWSQQGASHLLANMPCGLAFDLFIRHLMRIHQLDVINSCDAVVRESGVQSVKDG